MIVNNNLTTISLFSVIFWRISPRIKKATSLRNNWQRVTLFC